MLSIERFTSLARSYGANFDLWPIEVRGDALALLEVSKEARAVLAEECKLDDAISAAPWHRETSLWPADERNAALLRLRTNVAARIAVKRPGLYLLPGRFFAYVRGLWPDLNWVGVASSGGIAVVAGLFIGMHFPSVPASNDLVSTLQVASIPIFME